MLWRVEPAASVGERLDVNGGRGSGEGAGAPTGLLNKQGQLLPRALGSYSELFDFPNSLFSPHACWIGCIEPHPHSAWLIRACVQEEIQWGPGTQENWVMRSSTATSASWSSWSILVNFHCSPSLLPAVFHFHCCWKSVSTSSITKMLPVLSAAAESSVKNNSPQTQILEDSGHHCVLRRGLYQGALQKHFDTSSVDCFNSLNLYLVYTFIPSVYLLMLVFFLFVLMFLTFYYCAPAAVILQFPNWGTNKGVSNLIWSRSTYSITCMCHGCGGASAPARRKQVGLQDKWNKK